jgi:hypothetical protein
MKRAMPMYAAGVLAGCYVFAAIERLAMTSAAGFAVLAASLVAALVLLRWRDAIARRHSVPLEIEAPPDGAMQRLDLSS